jgi:two-component system sensor histidine kinase DesK
MHDLLGHNLSLIALKSELARKLLGRDPQAAEAEVRDIESVARTSLHEARAAVRGLRSASLASELERARGSLQAAGLEAEVRTTGPLPARVETLLGFVVREGVTNVIRHSGGSRCWIAVRRDDESAELEVRDDGVSADVASTGSGLRGLSERVAEVGGTLEAEPAEGGGFRLVARVPIAATALRSGEADAAPLTPAR